MENQKTKEALAEFKSADEKAEEKYNDRLRCEEEAMRTLCPEGYVHARASIARNDGLSALEKWEGAWKRTANSAPLVRAAYEIFRDAEDIKYAARENLRKIKALNNKTMGDANNQEG